MADINSIQDEAQEKAPNSAGGVAGKLGKVLAPMQNALKKILGDKLNVPFDSQALNKIKQNKPLFYGILGGVGLLLVLLLVLLILALMPNDKANDKTSDAKKEAPKEEAHSQDDVQKLLATPLPDPTPDTPDSSVDNLIIKGNLLYDQGYHQEAYEVFRKIADFSQSIANYNLGTIELKSKLYENSIAAYGDSIQTGQNVSVSAINAAVSALKLGRFDLHSYYLQIANDNINEILNEPLYSYSYALLSYYGDHYFESLSPLLNPNTKDFEPQNNRLAAHIFTIFGDDSNAITHLKAAANQDDNKAIGLLYARKGDYGNAKSYLMRYLQNHNGDVESIMALQIIDLKLGNYTSSAQSLDYIASNKNLSQAAKTTYPIKVIINPELFDVSIAQKTFWERDFENKDKLGYKMLFYFAPYRVFDAKRALEEISQASNFAHVNITEGKNILLRSATTSKIDREIIRTLVQLESKDLRAALSFLKNATANNPNHAILYYNLGLVYAQLGQYDDAYGNFIRAYYLDQSDFLSGIFAVLTGRFSHKDTERVVYDMLQAFHSDDEHEQAGHDKTKHAFIGNFLNYLIDNKLQDDSWIQNATTKEPIYYALEYVYALKNKDKEAMLKNINALKNIYSDDVVINILAVLTKSFGESVREISIGMYNLFGSDSLDLRPIYYGGALPRELYVYTGFITGSLQNQARIIERHFMTKEGNPRGALQTLGAISIYQKDFQKAYAIYNSLLDEFKEDDSRTRFLTAVSAVGAGNYSDATLLLQLTKMETPTAYEARYALGLLYQSAQNLKAAATNYNFISLADFRSEFFDFQIDTQRIYSYELLDEDNAESSAQNSANTSISSAQNPAVQNLNSATPPDTATEPI